MPIVCVDGLVVNERGDFLLVKRQNEPFKGEYWVPGGRVCKGERLVDAIHRKMREELGIEVDIIERVGFFEFFHPKTEQDAEGGVHSISILYLLRPKTYEIKLDEQSCAWGWFNEAPPELSQYLPIRSLTTNRPKGGQNQGG